MRRPSAERVKNAMEFRSDTAKFAAGVEKTGVIARANVHLLARGGGLGFEGGLPFCGRKMERKEKSKEEKRSRKREEKRRDERIRGERRREENRREEKRREEKRRAEKRREEKSQRRK